MNLFAAVNLEDYQGGLVAVMCGFLLILVYQIQYKKMLALSFAASTAVAGGIVFAYTLIDSRYREMVYVCWAISAVLWFLTAFNKDGGISVKPYKVDQKTAFFLNTARGEKLWFGYPQDNFLVYGGAGSGKTKSIGKPLMEQFIKNKYAGFIYDFKDFDYTMSAYNLMKKWKFEEMDEKGVKRDFYYVSFTDLGRTFRFNPLKKWDEYEVKNEDGSVTVKRDLLISQTLLQQLMDDFLQAFLPSDAKKDEWFNGALGILTGVAYRFWDEYEYYCTLPHICNLIMTATTQQLTDFLKGNATAKSLAGAYMSAEGSEKTQASYMSSLQNYISGFATNKEVCYVLTGDEFTFNLVDPKNPKLFCVCNNYAINAILSPVISMLFAISSRKFSFDNRQNFVYVLDEMTTFKVTNFEMLPSTLREFGVAFILLTQSGAKLEKLYNKFDRSSIEANFANMFLGRTKDVEALKYYPSFFGKHEVTKKSKTTGSSSGGSSNSVTINTQKEEVYEAKAFTALQPGEFIGSAGHTNKPEFHEQFAQYKFEGGWGEQNGKDSNWTGKEIKLPVRKVVTEKEINEAYELVVAQNAALLGTE